MTQLNRNDPHAAAAAYRAGLLAGTWTPDKSRLILSMQDDPSELLSLIQSANADPEVGAALRFLLSKSSGSRAPRADTAQARDYHGRFASGYGAHHDAARVERVRAEAASIAKASGHVDYIARSEHEAHKEREAVVNEHRALAAGHIKPIPTGKLAEYDTVHARIQREALQRSAQLDEGHGRAVHALSRLEATSDHEARIGGHDVHDVMEAHSNASSALGHVAGRPESAEISYESHHVPEPHGSIGEHPGAGNSGAAAYERAHAARSAAYHRRAQEAQDILEQLHEHQVRAAAETRTALREHNEAARGMLREANRDAERAVKVGWDHPEHSSALRASETLGYAEMDRRGDISSAMQTRLEDAHGALREAARETSRTLRDLGKITGRTPKLAEYKAKT